MSKKQLDLNYEQPKLINPNYRFAIARGSSGTSYCDSKGFVDYESCTSESFSPTIV